MFKLLAIIMWISVLWHQLSEGYRFPGHQATMKTHDNVIEGPDWGEDVEDDVFTISNAIDHVENNSDTKNDSIDFMPGIKDKRNNVRSPCSCHSKGSRIELGDNSYPSHFIGKVCDESRQNLNCRFGRSCKETHHEMLVLKHKVGHNLTVHRGPLHNSIKNDFYWDIKVSGVMRLGWSKFIKNMIIGAEKYVRGHSYIHSHSQKVPIDCRCV